MRVKFERTPGVVLFAPELAEEFAAPVHVIQQTISNMRRENEGQPLVHIPAQAWVYKPSANGDAKPTGGRIFEQIATTKNGAFILQDEAGNIYKAQEID